MSCSVVWNHSKNCQYPFKKDPCEAEKLAMRFQRRRRLQITQFYMYTYSPGTRADNPGGGGGGVDKILIVTEKVLLL